MNLEATFAQLNELKPRNPGIQRSYAMLRERTEKEFGGAMAESIDRAVSDIFTCIVKRMAGQLQRDDMVALCLEGGWRICDTPNPTDILSACHNLASVEQRGQLAGHSQFEGAFLLNALNTKYFGLIDERTVVLSNDHLPGSMLSLSNLGDTPDPDYAFGLKAVMPHQADYLLWWATKQSSVWQHFSEPTDLHKKSWAVFDTPNGVDRRRSFAKSALGKLDFSLGPSKSEERFYLSAFGATESEPPNEPAQGTYLAYHLM